MFWTRTPLCTSLNKGINAVLVGNSPDVLNIDCLLPVLVRLNSSVKREGRWQDQGGGFVKRVPFQITFQLNEARAGRC